MTVNPLGVDIELQSVAAMSSTPIPLAELTLGSQVKERQSLEVQRLLLRAALQQQRLELSQQLMPPAHQKVQYRSATLRFLSNNSGWLTGLVLRGAGLVFGKKLINTAGIALAAAQIFNAMRNSKGEEDTE